MTMHSQFALAFAGSAGAIAGVFLLASCSDDTEVGSSGSGPTFYADVQPLIDANCRSCHQPGGSAPFSLTDYASVSTYADASLAAMEAGTMPPWPADPGCRTFEDERIVLPEDIELFREWMDAGKRAGEPASATEYQVPDLVLEPTHSARSPAFSANPSQSDDYRCFILDDLSFDKEMYLKASQVLPGSSQVHHVLVYGIAPSLRDTVDALDAEDEGPGYTCFGGPLPLDGGPSSSLVEGFPNQLAAWVPGQTPAAMDADTAIRLEAGSTVVMQVHYSTLSGAAGAAETELQLVLTEEPPAKLLSTKPLAIFDLEIPAGEANVEASKRFTNYGNEPVVIKQVTGHMHLLGSSLDAQLVDGGQDQCILSIPDWDFNWQQSYRTPADAPIVVPPNASIDFTCRYDNSAANQPVVNGSQIEPVDVAWGDGTLDEMCLLYIGQVEPFAAAPPSDSLPCYGLDSCDDICGPEPTLDCLLGCEETDTGCSLCVLNGASTCGLTGCLPQFLASQDCLTDCFLNAFMLEGSVAACMKDRCSAEYEAVAGCLDPVLATGVCDDALDACGATF